MRPGVASEHGVKVEAVHMEGMVDEEALARSGTQLLSDVPLHARITVEAQNVCAFVPVLVTESAGGSGSNSAQPDSDSAKGGKESKERQVLYNVSACVEPGEMLALMGPSGSGKSSLLTLLGGRSTARLQGSITFNGSGLSKASKRKLGYVAQDDLLFAELTVYETLYFAAMLRLPRTWAHADKLKRVEMVLQGLGLDKCRDTIIGNHMMRGVSGGERKRVSIGHELLINPSVIFLDEPTSGLDSTTALKLMHTLRSLASGGRTIITSIHQPSSRLYQQMDKLLLLAEGYTIYYGDAHVCAHWFASLGQAVPFGVSTADHILDLACGDLPGWSKSKSQEVLDDLITAFKERLVGKGRHGILPEHLGQDAVIASATSRRDRLASLRLTAAAGDAKAIVPVGTSAAARVGEEAGRRTLGRGTTGTLTATHEEEEVELQGHAGALGASPASSSERLVSLGQKLHGGAGSLRQESGSSVHRSPSQGSMPIVSLQLQPVGKGEELADVEQGAADGLGDSDSAEEGKWGASWFDQVRYLVQRSLKTRRFSALSYQRIAECMVVGVLAGLFWFQAGAGELTTQSALDVGGLLFFEVLFLAFSSLFQAIFNYPPEFSMVVKERQSGMYRLSAYYVARSLADLPMDCALPSLLTWILYWMAGLRISAAAFFANWGAVLLTVMLAQSIGLLIGATINNLKTCMTTATISMLTIMLVGGYYVRGIPVWISWLKYISFIYYSWNLTLMIEFSNRPMAPSACVPASSECTVAKANVYPIDVDAVPVLESCVLVAMLLVLRVATYCALNIKTTFKRKP